MNMFDFTSHYRFILPSAEIYFDFKGQEEEAKAAIDYIREKNLPIFVADWSNDAGDAVFINVPHLNVRYFNPYPITEHLDQTADLFGDIAKHQNEIYVMFGFSLSNAPPPAVADDWETYTDWMKHLLKEF